MRRNIGIVKDSSFAASNVEQKIFMTMSLMVRLVGFFCLFRFYSLVREKNACRENSFSDRIHMM